MQLGHGIQAYWEDGTLAVGDVWYITCGNQEIKPHRMLVTLNDSVPTDPDPWGEAHTFVHGLCDYYATYQNFEIDFSQFWRLGNIIDCRDRQPGRWGNWSNHYLSIGTPYEMIFYDVEDEEDNWRGDLLHQTEIHLEPEPGHSFGPRVLRGHPGWR